MQAFMSLSIPEDLRRDYSYPQITREDKRRRSAKTSSA
jgi:hypothetical protein